MIEMNAVQLQQMQGRGRNQLDVMDIIINRRGLGPQGDSSRSFLAAGHHLPRQPAL